MWFCLGRFEHWGWLDKLLGNDNGHDDDIFTCLFYLLMFQGTVCDLRLDDLFLF